MAFLKALTASLVRLAALGIVLWLIHLPFAMLRPRFYPNGMDGVLVLLILLGVITTSMLCLYFWVSKPLQKWWEDYQEQLRTQLSQN